METLKSAVDILSSDIELIRMSQYFILKNTKSMRGKKFFRTISVKRSPTSVSAGKK